MEIYKVESMEGVSNYGYLPSPSLNNFTMAEIYTEREKISFHQAARYGNVASIQRYLKNYRGRTRKINKLNKQELSALHYAVRHGHLNVVKLLLQARADVNVVGADGAQPIHYAAKYFKTSKHINENTSPSKIRHVEPLIVQYDSEDIYNNNKNNSFQLKHNVINNNNRVDDIITLLLQNGANVNALDNYNQTPLNYAAVKGNLEATTILLNRSGIDVEITDTSGGTALHNACGNGNTDVAKLLLLAGAQLMTWDYDHKNPLHYAASGNGMKILKEIFSDIENQGGKVGDWTLKDIVNDQDNQGHTLLHLSVDSGNYETCCLVIEKGADVNLCKSNFITPLHLAAALGDINIVKLLLASGGNIEAQNAMLETPLHRAAHFNRSDVAKFLLDQGCYVNSANNSNATPLIAAAANENFETINVLLQFNADMKTCDSAEKSAIFVAAEHNSIKSLELLLDRYKIDGGDSDLVNQRDRFDNTPLHVAAKNGFKQVVDLLLKYNAEVDSSNDEDLTPLHVAAIKGNKKVVHSLLENKPSIINDEDESGNTALHLAALNGQWKVIHVLTDYGASVDPRNSLLWTPLDCAAANGHVNAVKCLLERNAPIDPIDLANTTPLHLASRAGHYEVVDVLLENGSDITLLNHAGLNAFDKAIENSHWKVALRILEHRDWLSVLKNRSIEGGGLTTPMRELIKKAPDIAYTVLNKCMKLSTHLPLDSIDYRVIFYFDLLDDTYSDWSNEYEEDDQRSVAISSMGNNQSRENVNKLTENVIKTMEKKENHPLAMMCKYKRDKLLNHPLVLSLIYEKWQRFGRVVFYLKFSLYFIFLFFLTGYVLVSRPLIPSVKNISINSTKCTPNATKEDKNDVPVIIFFIIGRLVVIVLGCTQLFLELCQLIARRLTYFADITNLMEWCINILAILYTWSDIDEFIALPDCSSYHISVGSVCIFLAWIDLLLFLQKFPTLGIYVVMFTDVLKTFMKFSLTFLLFVIAFGLGFYTLLGSNRPYMNIGRALMKTTVMMIGEFDFDDQFNSAQAPPLITWVLFFIFIIIMTILLMNLMVGLAVDDIKGVLDQAVLTRVAMQVHLVLDVEKSLPSRLRSRYTMKEKIIYPNRDFLWSHLMSHITKMDDIQEAVKPTKSVSDIVQEHTQSTRESVDQLKANFKDMSKQMKNIEQMLETILKASDITNDADD